MKKKYFFLSALVIFFAAGILMFAAYAQQAPSEAEIKAEQQREEAEAKARVQSEIGVPTETYIGYQPAEIPKFEEPGSVPADVRQYVTDADIVPIYCAMSKWKSGQFFIAINAIKNNLIPALGKVKDVLGAEVVVPDVDSMAAEGQKRLDAICGAKTIDEADRLTRDLSAWGQQIQASQFGPFEKDLSAKMKAKGDELRKKIEAEINPVIEAEKARTEKEIQGSVDAYVASIEFDHEPSVSELAAVRSQVEQFVNSKVAAKKAELQQKINSKVEEIRSGLTGQFLSFSDALKNVGPKIDAEVKAKASSYDQYRDEAFRLRKEAVFTILDKNMAEGLKQLDAAAADLEEAKKTDPTVKTAGEIKAELQNARQVLETEIDAALRVGDEAAFQKALADFRIKWENVRRESEQAAGQGISKGCAAALAQFQQAKVQIDSQLPKLLDLRRQCSGSVSEECAKINELSPRFESIIKKLADLKAEMALAEEMCRTPETADRKNLIALFQKIKTDAEDARLYGQALEAEKTKAIADSFQKICAQVLPQLRAGKNELEKSQFASLKKTLEECRGKTDDRCKIVNQLASSFNALDARLTSFNNNLAEIETLCQKGGDETQMERLSVILHVLKSEGDEIRAAAKNLEAEAADKTGQNAVCRAVLPSLTEASAQITAGLQEMKSIGSDCPVGAPGCQQFLASALVLQSRIGKMVQRISAIKKTCDAAAAGPPTSEFLNDLQGAREESQTLLKDIDKFKLEGEKLKKEGSGKIWIEAENEAKSNLLPHTEAWHSHKWTQPAPWRPPLFGSGYWYLSRGGEYLEYQISVQTAGTYNVWIRDYVDKFQPKGVRVVVVSFDGRRYGAFPEVDKPAPGEKGVFGWHKAGSGISLSAGSHTMRITKEATTAGAAILDAFYLTTGSEIPAEK